GYETHGSTANCRARWIIPTDDREGARSELSFWDIARDHDKQEMFAVGVTLVPLAAPTPRNRHKRLVGVVVVHQRTVSRLAPRETQIKPFGNGNGGQPGGFGADRRHVLRVACRLLESDHVEQSALVAWQVAVRKPVFGALQILEEGHPLHHLVPSPNSHWRHHIRCSLVPPRRGGS